MSLVRLDNVTKNYSGEPVLVEAGFRIEEGERVAIVGRNGTGKTTLFRLITGETEPDGGVVERMRRARIVYVAQVPECAPDATVHDIALHSFDDLVVMEARLQELESALAEGGDAALEAYGEYQHEFAARGGYEFRTRARQILCGVGFSVDDFDLPFQALSGGWRARLMLSLALMREVDLLLLDEPENHLDMDAREWLEEHLRGRAEAVALISHDRRMVNNLAHRVVEIERGELTSYTGNYDAYMKEKALRREQQEKTFARQNAFIQKEQAWIDRFRAKNTKARQAQNRMKRLEKIELVDAPPPEMDTAAFNLGNVERSGDVVVDARDLSMAYPDNPLYAELSFYLQRGERLGIIGPNGSGKTTLLRQLAGCHSGLGGTVRLGHNVRPAFYEQHQEQLDPRRDLLGEMQAFRPDWSGQQCRTYLGRFLFTGDDVFKTTGVLSGGERSRLALAKLIASDANLLFLDEPTNHLDMASREALENSLAEFAGSIIVVSHDRTLIDRIVERLIIVQDGRAQFYYGNFSEWRQARQSEAAGEAESPEPEKLEQRQKKVEAREERKTREREVRREQRRIEELESAIAALEQEIEQINAGFATLDPADYTRAQDLKNEYDAARDRLDQLYDQWAQTAG